MSETVELEHRDLRSAIEFAVAMADELAKRKRTIAVPRELRGQVGKARLPTASLGRLRRAIEAAPTFRAACGAGAVPELVDPIGILWLQQPDGWEAAAHDLIAESRLAAEDADLRVRLRRAEKRQRAAEQVAVRSRVDLAAQMATIESLRAEIDVLRAEAIKADDSISELRAELVDVRNEARHARDREAAAKSKLEAELAAAVTHTAPAVAASAPVEAPSIVFDPTEVAELARAARDVAERADALLAPVPDGVAPTLSPRREHRRPLKLPGGVIASSSEAAEFLMRSDAAVLVDGYNVAKLGWPSRSLEDQRNHLLDALENMARRFGTDISVIFDGSSVVGAHTARRRLLRVVYSPDGVIADDVIRDEVRRLPVARSVVVATSDAEIVADVRALGANVVPSNALFAIL